VSVPAAKQAYTREEARRLVGISERQLKSWEEQKLLARHAHYSFRELLALRTLIRLRRDRVPAAQIKRALAALRRKLAHLEDPLTDLKLYADGKRVHVEIEGKAMEAESFQLLLNFDQVELRRMLEFPAKDPAAEEREKRATAERWFQRGLDLEQSGQAVETVIEAYEKALELDPNSAGALVNLGTIHFNGRDYAKAKKYYERALEVDPQYALAHFDLANLYDERGERAKAMEHYQAALKIAPNYADAHYNLALLYQGSNQTMRAVQHWTTYLKLDPAGHWANIARKELAKLRESAVVPGLK